MPNVGSKIFCKKLKCVIVRSSGSLPTLRQVYIIIIIIIIFDANEGISLQGSIYYFMLSGGVLQDTAQVRASLQIYPLPLHNVMRTSIIISWSYYKSFHTLFAIWKNVKGRESILDSRREPSCCTCVGRMFATRK
jgi:hypothetical protein